MRSLVTLAFLFIAFAPAACSGSKPDPRAVAAAASAAEPAPIALAADRKDIVYRYVAPSGEVTTAASVDDIPAAARREVVVWDPASPSPPGWDHVADLTRGLPATALPKKDFRFPAHAASAATAANGANASGPAPPALASRAHDNKSGHEVFMFTTEGCGYCAKARKFMKSKSIPYTELDLEADAGAAQKLAALGKKAGVPASRLQGVPIIFIDGRPVIGWDQGEVAKLLGI